MQNIAAASSLLVSSTALNLQLYVTSQTLLSSCSLPSAFLSSVGSEREIWVSRGKGFCLSFRVLVDGKHARTNDPQHGNLIEGFARALRGAELWTQLRLQASLSLPSHNQYGPDSLQRHIVIHLSHLRTDVDVPGSSQQPGRASSSPLANVEPPLGIPLATINEVHLTLAFSTNIWNPTFRRRAPKRSKTATGILSNEKGPLQGPLDVETDDIEGLCSPQPAVSTRYKEDQELHLSPDETPISTPLQPTHPQLYQTPRDFHGRLPRKRAAEVLQNGVDESASHLLNKHPELEHMVLLADMALRNLITDRPLRTPPGVVLAGAAPAFRLSEVAPSLWSPGYLPAISERSRFLTVISRAISFPIYTYARSSTLKGKLERLSSLPPSPLMYTASASESQHPSQDQSTSAAIHNVVQARLWRMMQQGLYNPGAARRLKPVKLFNARERDGLERYPDEILQEDRQEDLTLEHEMLLEDQTIDNSICGADAPEDCREDDMLIDLDYEGDLPFEQVKPPMSSGQEVSNFKEWYYRSVARAENDHFLDPNRDFSGMPTIGVYDEALSVMDECHELLCETDLIGTCGSDSVAGDSFQGLQEDGLLVLIGDEPHSAINNMYEPLCEADFFGIPKSDALASGSFQGLQEEGELVLAEGDLLFSEENLVRQQEQRAYTEDEMLF